MLNKQENCEDKVQMNSDEINNAGVDIPELNALIKTDSSTKFLNNIFVRANPEFECRDVSNEIGDISVRNNNLPGPIKSGAGHDSDNLEVENSGSEEPYTPVGAVKYNRGDNLEHQGVWLSQDNIFRHSSDTGSDSPAVDTPDNKIDKSSKRKETRIKSILSAGNRHQQRRESQSFSSDSDDGLLDIPEISSTFADDKGNKKKSRRNSNSTMESKSTKSPWQSLKTASTEFKEDSRRLCKFVKHKLSLKKNGKKTTVKSIHILPEGDELRWARRSASSANSKTSVGTSSSVESRTSDSRTEVVNDLDDEFLYDHS